MPRRTVTIDVDGQFEWSGDFLPNYIDPDTLDIRRVSRIVPDHWLKGPLFLLLRKIFGDEGKVAAWTRNWEGPHTCTLLDYGVTTTHESRAIALRWERFMLATIEEENQKDARDLTAVEAADTSP